MRDITEMISIVRDYIPELLEGLGNLEAREWRGAISLEAFCGDVGSDGHGAVWQTKVYGGPRKG
jgi:hypothetical protein